MQTALETVVKFSLFRLYGFTAEGICKCPKGKQCTSPGKHGAANWETELWSGTPGAEGDYGIRTGRPSNLIVLDVDLKQGKDGFASLASAGHEIPPTYTVRTPSGGAHYYFIRPNIEKCTTRSEILTGVDIRADGGLVVAERSHNPMGEYTLAQDLPFAPCPDWLKVASLPKHTTLAYGPSSFTPLAEGSPEEAEAVEHAIRYLQQVAPAVQGQRGHAQLFNVAQAMTREHLLRPKLACDLATVHYNPRCVPPWDMANNAHCEEFTRKFRTSVDEGHFTPGAALQAYAMSAAMMAAFGEKGIPITFGGLLGDASNLTTIPKNIGRKRKIDCAHEVLFHHPDVFRFKNAYATIELAEGQLRVDHLEPATISYYLSDEQFALWEGAADNAPSQDVSRAALRKSPERSKGVNILAMWPILGRDGTIVCQVGYNEEFQAKVYAPEVDIGSPTQEEAAAAYLRLCEVLGEFCFAREGAAVVPIAAVMSVFCRHLFPKGEHVPAFLIDASAPRSGKGYLSSFISRVVSGEDPRSLSNPGLEWTPDAKHEIYGALMDGVPVLCFDNCTRLLGGARMDKLITDTRHTHTPKYLGPVSFQSTSLILANGNNMQRVDDFDERSIHVYLTPRTERPGEESFKIVDFLGHVSAHRTELMCDVLIILSAFLRAGCPDQNLGKFGAFQFWLDTVGGALAYAGAPNIYSFHAKKTGSKDQQTEVFHDLERAWPRDANGDYLPKTTRQILDMALQEGGESGQVWANSDLRDVCLALSRGFDHKTAPTNFGNSLKAFLGKIVGDARFGTRYDKKKKCHVWSFYPASDRGE